MLDIPKKEKLTSRLSATPCTPEMRDKIHGIATNKGVTMAEVQRYAIAFFLDNFATESSNLDTIMKEQAHDDV